MSDVSRLTFGSLFAGIGGFDLGFERAGMHSTWQVEIDKNCHSVLARHFKTTKRYEDVTRVGRSELEPVDVICGGFPCQDLSVAGNRKGLAGDRSGLWWEFHRIIGELEPRFVVIENVPGLLSSSEGRDFAAVLSGLAQLGYCSAWRVLDSQYYRVAQRRRRVFLVASLGDGSCAEILFEPESLRRDIAPRQEAREDVAQTLDGRAGRSGENTFNTSGGLAVAGHSIAGTLDHKACASNRGCQPNESEFLAIVGTLDSGVHPGGYNGQDAYNGKLIPVAATITKAYADHYGRTAGNNGGVAENHLIPIDLRNAVRDKERDEVNRQGSGIGNEGDPAHSVTRKPNGVAIPAIGVRRLTPRECERLQGFPDDWTRWGADGKEMSDSVRYRMCGNAVTVTVAEWIGRRIYCEGNNKCSPAN